MQQLQQQPIQQTPQINSQFGQPTGNPPTLAYLIKNIARNYPQQQMMQPQQNVQQQQNLQQYGQDGHRYDEVQDVRFYAHQRSNNNNPNSNTR